jgi:hypothetical protein
MNTLLLKGDPAKKMFLISLEYKSIGEIITEQEKEHTDFMEWFVLKELEKVKFKKEDITHRCSIDIKFNDDNDLLAAHFEYKL